MSERSRKEPEPDRNDTSDDQSLYFCFSASLRISGNDLKIDEITRTLGITPTHSHRKGERRGPGVPPWPHDMWSYEPPIHEERPLHEHIMALWDAVRSQISYLRDLKQTHHVDIFCGYRSNSGTAGFEVDHRCLGLFAELEVPFGVSVIIA